MARFVKLTSTDGTATYFVNLDQVTYMLPLKDAGQTLIHFVAGQVAINVDMPAMDIAGRSGNPVS